MESCWAISSEEKSAIRVVATGQLSHLTLNVEVVAFSRGGRLLLFKTRECRQRPGITVQRRAPAVATGKVAADCAGVLESWHDIE